MSSPEVHMFANTLVPVVLTSHFGGSVVNRRYQA
jgi:hypothetical protein